MYPQRNEMYPMSGDVIQFLPLVGVQTQFGKDSRKLCGAASKRTGNPCRQPAMKNGRCRLHGGMTPKHAERHATPKSHTQWKRVLARLERKEHAVLRAELRKAPPRINWKLERELLSTGFLHRLHNDQDRHELRRAYALYVAEIMPWYAWHETLQRLGLR